MTAATITGARLPALGVAGLAGRAAGWAVVGLVVALPTFAFSNDLTQTCTRACLYAITGLSLNLLVGYTGQLSLGHQGLLGIGALAAANLFTSSGLPLPLALAGAVLAGAVTATLLGLVALRITGLYLALITLVFGFNVASSLFVYGPLDGNGAGRKADRPAYLFSDQRYYLVCLAALAVVVFLDIQLMRSKTGRALLAVKENERAAEAFGVDVTRYKLLAFGLSGAIVGLAGGLSVFISQIFAAANYQGLAGLSLALTFIVMVVVGGLGNRVGVVVASAFFALIDAILSQLFDVAKPVLSHIPLVDSYYRADSQAAIAQLIGSLLLLQTVIFNPGGLGQVLRPVSRWLTGHPFSLHSGDDLGGPAAVEGSSVRA